MPIAQVNSPHRGLPAQARGPEVDPWDMGASAMLQQGAADQDAPFSELVEVRPSHRASLLVYLLGGLTLAVVGYVFYTGVILEEDPLGKALAFWEGLWGEGDSEEAALVDEPPPQPVAQPKAAPAVSHRPLAVVKGNPYWALPNAILGPKARPQRPWTVEEEEALRTSLGHRFVYQHYKAVQEVRRDRLRGSDVILWEALGDRKFWTRMLAAIGLAEMSAEVSIAALDQALKGARSELVADFFERFVKRPAPAHAFLLRQVVRLVDEKGRLVVLQGIDRAKDPLRDLYLAAATLDPAPKVQRWVRGALARRPIAASRLGSLVAVVQGQGTLEGLLDPATLSQVAASLAPPSKAESKPKAPQPPEITTAEDLDQAATIAVEGGGEAAGDVEFFEVGRQAESASPDGASLDDGLPAGE